jgi:hypothetical protein
MNRQRRLRVSLPLNPGYSRATGVHRSRLRCDANADRAQENNRSLANAFRHFRHMGAH